ncbi:MAG: M56 family metallopeptidase [Bacteroidota bacterium]
MGSNNFLHALGWAVLNSLWQMALLWVLYQVITGLFSGKASGEKILRSSAKSWLASSLLMTGFVWFIYTFISILTSHSADDMIVTSGLVNAQGNQQLNDWLHKTLPLASIFYIGLLVLPVLHFIRNYRYVQIIRNHGLAKANVEWRMFVRNVSEQMGIKKPVHIWVSELVSSPVTIGYLKPVILIPLAALNHLSTQQMEAVLLHELSHIKRHDYLINLIINFIQTILYFNPFVKALVKTVEREREKSCDEMVIQFQYNSHEYASALLILEKNHTVSKSLVVAASGKSNDLLHRIELILGVKNKSVLSFNRIAGVLVAILSIIAINALLIISKPSNNNKDISFNTLSSPFYFFTNDKKAETPQPAIASNDLPTEERRSATIINSPMRAKIITKDKNKPMPVAATAVVPMTAAYPVSDFINVKYAPVQAPPPPVLKNYQEEQVKEAMDASKKVLENVQWKAIEKNVAEVLTRNEKEILKLNYQNEVNKINWNKLENKLRLAYKNIDWDQINEQLTTAVAQIRIDSIQKVYSEVASNLDLMQKELATNDQDAIPDTDITLKEIELKKKEVTRTLNTLKAIQSKKIIHL